MNEKVNIVELSEASSLGKVISSKTAQDIITYIGDHEGCTATDIKNNMVLPASTIHYNLKALIEAKIIDDSNFNYSEKGKPVVHYNLTNKILIVVPKKLKDTNLYLKAVIPGLFVIAGLIGISFILKIFALASSGFRSADTALNSAAQGSAPMAMKFSSDAMEMASSASSIQNPGDAMNFAVQEAFKESAVNIPWYLSPGFFIGLGVAFIISITIFFFVKKRKNNN